MPDDNLETWYLDDKGEDVTVHLIHLKLPTVFSVQKQIFKNLHCVEQDLLEDEVEHVKTRNK